MTSQCKLLRELPMLVTSKVGHRNKRFRRSVGVRGEPRSANRTKWGTSQPVSDSTSQNKGSFGSLDGVEREIWSEAEGLQAAFHDVDKLVHKNISKVQRAFRNARVGPHHFSGSTGYGHGDLGRRALDEVVAEVMGAESALVRTQFVSGTHAIACALFGVLRPGDRLLSAAGRPYDTMEEVIGIRGEKNAGSLASWGVDYGEVPLLSDGGVDLVALHTAIATEKPRAALIQRSCGYALRPTLTIHKIAEAIEVIRQGDPSCLILVDNCYGEFTEPLEPCNVGADLVMGSMIKNPGGTIAAGGGYVAGKEALIGLVGERLTAPGVGLDAGCVPGESLRTMMQGFFLAPQMVGEALKAGRLIASVFEKEGYTVVPNVGDPVPSFITAIEVGSPEKMVAFCQAVQNLSPVGSFVVPVPGVTAGYGDEVIFADGTFIDGSTSELSADGPIRPPFVVYCQGGTHWTHWATVLASVISALRSL
ncbi:hypothetical protein BSKO_05544 [Bryopsis sp. KO-2023]|nr:hypothetical protein BSKO_05544 [Bryopsis sp. KO-2023]